MIPSKPLFSSLSLALLLLSCSEAPEPHSFRSESKSADLNPLPAVGGEKPSEESVANDLGEVNNEVPSPLPSNEILEPTLDTSEPKDDVSDDETEAETETGSDELSRDTETRVSEAISFETMGPRVSTSRTAEAVITEGQIRPRRRHENDMDFSKYNPFYWEGRQASFKVEDFTVSGQKKIKFTMITEWPQNYIPTRGPDLSALYSGSPLAASETERSKFRINMRMKHIRDFKVFEATLDQGVFNTYPASLKKGEILTFEFRFFMDESFEGWKKQKDKDFHNISAYYSEFFRVRVGEAGLFIDHPDDPKAVPSPYRSAGGWLTIPTVRVEPWKALQQQALNLSQANSQDFMTGRTWFHTDFVSGQHVRDASDDKPTVFFDETRDERKGLSSTAYNVTSCNACHVNNGTALLPVPGKDVLHTVAKTFDRTKGSAHNSFGQQLQTKGAKAEGSLKIDRYEEKIVTLDDGTRMTLKKPLFKVESTLETKNLGLSLRRPQSLIGLGLLEAVPEASLKKIAETNGGTYQTLNGRMGRFGWKADKTSLKEQIGAALRNDIGVTSRNFVELDCGTGCESGRETIPDEAIEKMESYLALLGVPPRMRPEDPLVKKGEAIFDRLSCGSCHVKVLSSGNSERFPEVSGQKIQAFTDLLLHDMGPDLADDSGHRLARHWRTAPLWGMKNVKHSTNDHLKEFPAGNINILWTDTHRVANQNEIQFLHDGRASTLAEAILWHGGAAEKSTKAYRALKKDEREALEAFLWDL